MDFLSPFASGLRRGGSFYDITARRRRAVKKIASDDESAPSLEAERFRALSAPGSPAACPDPGPPGAPAPGGGLIGGHPAPRGFPGRWKGGARRKTVPTLPKENADFRPGCEERHPAAGRRLVSPRPEDSIPGKPEISLENLQTIFKGKGRFSGFFQPDVAGSNRERMRASPPEIPERELTFPAISVTIMSAE